MVKDVLKNKNEEKMVGKPLMKAVMRNWPPLTQSPPVGGNQCSCSIDAGKVHPRDDFKIRVRYLSNTYEYDITEARYVERFVKM